MCGIVGILNSESLKSEAIEILKKLEYRGYDSAGISLFSQQKIRTIKSVGKISNLEIKSKNVKDKSFSGVIGHTRWATHGVVSRNNAHLTKTYLLLFLIFFLNLKFFLRS